MSAPSLSIGLSATEASGDRIGSLLIREMRDRFPDASFRGLGLGRMREAGFEEVCEDSDLAVMGYWDAMLRMRKILGVRRHLLRSMLGAPPNLFAGIDSPDFNFGVERRLKEKDVKVAHIVSPSLWAWRPERIEKIRKCIDLMLCLFPFEERIYREAGIPVTVIGHPDADSSLDDIDSAQAREKLGISGEANLVVTMMPGSRKQELANHLEVFIQAAKLIASRHEKPVFVIPSASQACHDEISSRICQSKKELNVAIVQERTMDCLRAADVAVIKSGTSTLQALLCGVPMVIVYRMSVVAYSILQLRKFHSKFIGLPNVLANDEICPELIQENVTAEKICQEVEQLLQNPRGVERYRERAQGIRDSIKLNARVRAADALSNLLERTGG